MAKREGVLDRYSPDWCGVFGFYPEPTEFAAVDKLKAMGVREASFQCGRTTGGGCFTNLMSVVAKKGQPVDVAWLVEVRSLCDGMGPQLFSEMVSVAGPDGDDPDTDCRHFVANGDLLLFVRMRLDKMIRMSVDVVIPTAALVETPAAG